MSYVEKAFYKFIKNIFTSGFRVLFSKRYIFYTIAFFLISVTSTIFYLIANQLTGTETYYTGMVLAADILIFIELSVAVTYIVFGIFFVKYPIKYWIGPALITAAGGTVLLYFLPLISPFVTAIGYFGWILVSIFLTFSVQRNFWGNKVLGSIMFLGKQANEGTIIFSLVAFILSILNAAMGGYLLYYSIFVDRQIFLLVSACFVIVAAILTNIIIFVLGKRDDVFYTILAFFYVFSSFTLWKLTIYTATGNEPSDNIGSIITAVFLIFYTVSRYAIKVKRIEKGIETEIILIEEELPKRKRKKNREITETEEEKPWFLLKIPRFMTPLGVLMAVMGLILSYHVTFLQLITDNDIFYDVFGEVFDKNGLVYFKDKMAVIIIPVMMIFFIINYQYSKRFVNYASPELFRYEFLPPFDELIERIDRIKRGEDSWKIYANMVLKEGVKFGVKSAATKVFISPSKKVAGAIGGAYTKTKSGIGKVFRRKKKEEVLEENEEEI
ncbi:MAG: hypothetical protein GOP50_06560 [Candidatus Heimdallarchaeota archaeon]|nr:hypothetical protein [Candidatus Heimdallarchaeota archaeon]